VCKSDSNQAHQQNTNKVQIVRVTERSDGQRLDNFLIRELKGVPRSRIYRLIRRGEVRVNKKRSKPEFKLSYGDEVRIPPIRQSALQKVAKVSPGLEELLKKNVLLETELLLVLNKPAGLAVHGGSGVDLGLIEALRQLQDDWANLELVHRLDRDTSGCLLISKKSNILKKLQSDFKEKRVEKTYHALVHGNWPKDTNLVTAPLMKNQLSSGERIVCVAKEGKEAETRFKVLAEYQQSSLIEAKPVTGRTHQIRVHCQYTGNPIIGDGKYGPRKVDNSLRSIKKLCLHAQKIRIPDPCSDGILEVSAPWDKYFAELNGNLKNS